MLQQQGNTLKTRTREKESDVEDGGDVGNFGIVADSQKEMEETHEENSNYIANDMGPVKCPHMV